MKRLATMLALLAAGAAGATLISTGTAGAGAAYTVQRVREANVDALGNIRVHEQGTAYVKVTNSSLPVHEQGTANVAISGTPTVRAQLAPAAGHWQASATGAFVAGERFVVFGPAPASEKLAITSINSSSYDSAVTTAAIAVANGTAGSCPGDPYGSGVDGVQATDFQAGISITFPEPFVLGANLISSSSPPAYWCAYFDNYHVDVTATGYTVGS